MIVTVEWTIRAAGRDEGTRETVELTPYVQALIDQGRVVVTKRHPIIQELEVPLVAVPQVAALDADTGSPVPAKAELPAEAIGELQEILLAAAESPTVNKPRRPRPGPAAK